MNTSEQGTTLSHNSNKNCLIITIVVAIIGLLACILGLVLILMLAYNFTGVPPGALEPPEPAVYLEVLPDGCAVRRGEVVSPEIRELTWVLLDRRDNPVEQISAGETMVYRHPVPGKYVVFLQARVGGRTMRVSREVLITCP